MKQNYLCQPAYTWSQRALDTGQSSKISLQESRTRDNKNGQWSIMNINENRKKITTVCLFLRILELFQKSVFLFAFHFISINRFLRIPWPMLCNTFFHSRKGSTRNIIHVLQKRFVLEFRNAKDGLTVKYFVILYMNKDNQILRLYKAFPWFTVLQIQSMRYMGRQFDC